MEISKLFFLFFMHEEILDSADFSHSEKQKRSKNRFGSEETRSQKWTEPLNFICKYGDFKTLLSVLHA